MIYAEAVQQLRREYAALPPAAPVRLGKKTSNLLRTRADAQAVRAVPQRPPDRDGAAHEHAEHDYQRNCKERAQNRDYRRADGYQHVEVPHKLHGL